jgi:hypothetical protein
MDQSSLNQSNHLSGQSFEDSIQENQAEDESKKT